MQYNSLSVVISSHLTEEENKKFTSHIKKTIGLRDYEILLYENFNEYSLTEIYNIGLNESSNDIVLFVHNDVNFDTNNWGRILLAKFNNTDYGILGLAGTTDIGNDGMWWSERNKMVGIVNHSDKGKKWESKYSNSYGKEIIETCLVDGVFIAVNKNRLYKQFNESFKGFHFYDVTFSLDNYLNGCKVGVLFDIRITHFSIGQTNSDWERNRLKFTSKYDKYLPVRHEVSEIRDNIKKTIKLKREPLLSVIIPHKNNNELLFNLIESIKEHTEYSNYKIYIADTGSEYINLYNLKDFIKKYQNIFIIEYNFYNFANINNDMVKNHIDKDTEVIMFLNNDVVFMNDIIRQMIDVYLKYIYNVGTIGCRLYYKDNSVQHSSVNVSKFNENYRVSHYGIGSYYKYIKDTHTNVFGNTAACMMTPAKLFKEYGMFNGDYIECFEDVEYNFKCLLNKKNNIFVGGAIGYHLESQTRDLDKDKNNKMLIDYNKLNSYLKNNSVIVDKFVNKLI
jgi:GT2 family glycosyltransferase